MKNIIDTIPDELIRFSNGKIVHFLLQYRKSPFDTYTLEGEKIEYDETNKPIHIANILDKKVEFSLLITDLIPK